VTNAIIQNFAFQNKTIRCVGTNRDPWFVAKDVCEALELSWNGRESLKAISDDWIRVRKLRTPMRQCDGSSIVVENEVILIKEAAVYALAFCSNTPSADAFTNWVCGEVLPSIRKAGEYNYARRNQFEKQGKQPGWIEQQEEGVVVSKGLASTLRDRGVTEEGYQDCTNAIHQPLLDAAAESVESCRDLKPMAQLHDTRSSIELAVVRLAELKAAEQIKKYGLKGNAACSDVCHAVGQAAASAIKNIQARLTR
jgi:prophage antirepressor-like protein